MRTGLTPPVPGSATLTIKAFRKAADNLTAGFAIINRQGRVIESNATFRKLFGEVNQALIQDVPLFQEMSNLSAGVFLRLLSEPHVERSFRHAPCRNAQGERTFLTYRIEKLRRNQLLLEVRETTQEKNEEFPSPDQERSLAAGLYANRVTHALKGSSAALTNTIDFLRENPERFSEYARNLSRIAERISAVIQQVLKATSEMEHEYVELNLVDFVREIKNLPDLQAKLAKGRIDISVVGLPITIEAAREQLLEALVYIVENAIEAILEKSEPFGKIRIEITEAAHARPEMARIQIKDDGPGIPPDRLQQIFEPFFTTKKEGTGIGLSTAKRIIEEVHDGKIAVETMPGAGTVFSVLLPIRSHRKIVAQKSSDVTGKLEAVRKRISGLGKSYAELTRECIAGMTMEHIRKSSEEELVAQIKGQVDRLEAFIATGEPHISVNNLSRWTEVVLACSKESAPRNYWENLILYELQKMRLSEEVSVVGTRSAERARAICRIFEIKRIRGQLTEEQRNSLEKTLQAKFTPIPSYAELNLQEQFLSTAVRLMQKYESPSSVHSIIFNPALMGGLRLVGYRTSFFPRSVPEIEEAVARRLVLERLPATEMFQYLIEQYNQSGFPVFYVNETLTTPMVEKFRIGPALSKFLTVFRVNSIIGAVFQTPQQGMVINFICSESTQSFPEYFREKFSRANQAWLERLTPHSKST